MLLSHVLSSIASPTPQCNLFVPLPTNPPPTSSTNGGVSTSEATPSEAESGSKDKEESRETLLEMHKEVKKMLGHVHGMVDTGPNDSDKVAIKQLLETKLKVVF